MKRVFPALLSALFTFVCGCSKSDPNTGSESLTSPAGEEPTAASTEAPEPPDETLARIHFIGTRQLLARTNAVTLNKIAALKETAAFKALVLNKLASAPARAAGQAAEAAADSAGVVRPLIEDILEEESFLEARIVEGSQPEWALATRLTPERATQWGANLKAFISKIGAGAPEPFKAGEATGWQAATSSTSRFFRFLANDSWAILGIGGETATLPAEMSAKIDAGDNPAPADEDGHLDITADFPRLVETFGWTRWSGLPHVDLQTRIEGDGVKTTGTIVLAKPLESELTEWRIPTNTVHDPLISFTAVNGTASWLDKLTLIQKLELNETPNQLFSWAMSGPFYLSYIALPAPGATNQIKALAAKFDALSRDELTKRGMGAITNIAGAASAHWINAFPIVRPFIGTSEEPDDSFLQLGLLPVKQGSFTNPPPAGLLELVQSRKNLIYYDWEITQARLGQLPTIFQLSTLLSKSPKLYGQTTTDRWVAAVGKLLGNTATEIIKKTPRELEVVRKSHLGLSAFEILMFAYWAQGDEFPLDQAHLPFLPLRDSATPSIPLAPPSAAPPAPQAPAPPKPQGGTPQTSPGSRRPL